MQKKIIRQASYPLRVKGSIVLLRGAVLGLFYLCLPIFCLRASGEDRSCLSFQSSNGVQLLVTNTLNQKTGYVSSSIILNQIPRSDYFDDPLEDNDTGIVTSISHSVSVSSPSNGLYHLKVIGISNTAFTVTVFARNADGTVQPQTVFTGTATVGSQTTFQFQYTNQTPPLATLTPASIVAGTGTTDLTLTGFGFNPNSIVQWNGGDLPTK